MPILAEQQKEGEVKIVKMPVNVELFTECQSGKSQNSLERILKKKADVNYKRPEDGMTPIYLAACMGSEPFVRHLLKAGADPNIACTSGLYTPLDAVTITISQQHGYDEACNDFESVNRLDDIYTAIRPDVKPLEAVKDALLAAGAVSKDDINGDDGSIKGGPPCELRKFGKYASKEDGQDIVVGE
eukprot:NODE_19334_length_848_cov_4.180305.p1 GENE.NODE_19334_length_848_cov_4.180305~~NODE_19334_length_848_cov_4.180305.p1  ORF type:complete len:186 (-),score=53.02 NODE_19334_length_848_cov_4.180305:182-739(-)